MKTIEEKAKAYDEALERAQKATRAGSDVAMDIVQYIFPELRESEDEKIIEEIKFAVTQMPSERQDTKDRCLAWLEKQKEQKPTSFNEPYNPDEYEVVMEGNATSLKRKEQKPAMSREKILHRLFQNGSITLSDYLYLTEEQKPVEKQDYSGLTDFERAIHRGFLCAGVENVPVTIIKETAQECMAKIKPAEWSEESNEVILKAVELLNRYGNSLCNGSPEKANEVYKVADSLKSLRTQPKQEWSEEDEKMRQHIISDLREFRDCETDEELISDYEDEIDWLKSLRPRWKPSEEQIAELKALANGKAVFTKDFIVKLYNDLLKLK